MTDVICPISHEVLSQEDCLKCALTWNNKCGYDYGILKAMYQKPNRDGIHVTDLTGCLRKAYYSKTQKIPVAVHTLLMLFTGTAMHDAFEKECDETAQCEMELEAGGIVGKADRVYSDGTLVDYKTTRWLTPSKLPYSSHELQLKIYAHMLGKMGTPVKQAFIQYVDMSGPTKCTAGTKWSKCNALVEYRDGKYVCPKCLKEFPEGHLGAYRIRVDLNDSIEHALNQSRDMLQSSIDDGTLPLPDPGWLCGYCQFNNICDAAMN